MICNHENCKGCCKGVGCTFSLIAKVLLIVGGLNWGLVGAGMLFAQTTSWNLVTMILGSMPMVEAVVYLLVGISALVSIFGCRCAKCRACVCNACGSEMKSAETK